MLGLRHSWLCRLWRRDLIHDGAFFTLDKSGFFKMSFREIGLEGIGVGGGGSIMSGLGLAKG